ncbi:aldehyde-activating protein [Phyllobacterium salinisoli]|uniref:Aldehyde-activating protein n=1 Tax=Phyllobacterium salinisoli TaxID=1899321 RepID=A0A368K0H8_9HYPH|nr:GFA family protein [Phyllobacterium salinisoli]RCS22906.1 aldehyde-activating protein [Phyllobacterium salinisoli]
MTGIPSDVISAENAGRRTASCACGNLKITVTGDPARVYACACLECQRATGSAFAYRARFQKAAIVHIEGERRAWRRGSNAGRWIEQTFCPTCGTLVYMEGEALPDAVVVSVGCFADPAFPPPAALFWASRRHDWYDLMEGVQSVD